MKIITTNKDLAALCKKAYKQPYIAVDTEFLSEKTYYPQLCLIQIALPENNDPDCSEFIIDTLQPNLQLAALKEIFMRPDIMKVFHSGKQDLEIFGQVFGQFPTPVFDTQIAAMLCGYGSQISYSNLVKDICHLKLDKSQQFSNWSMRPLSKRQLIYALSDVTHLRQVYTSLQNKLLESQRLEWVEELTTEMINGCKTSYNTEYAWTRIKLKNLSGDNWSVLYALARFREEQAQARNIPRRRILADHVLVELVLVKPRTHEELRGCRFFRVNKNTPNKFVLDLLKVINSAIAKPKAPPPHIIPPKKSRKSNREVTDLLKVYLSYASEQSGVAEELIATAEELREISQGNQDVPALRGWRGKLFGDNALKLCQGEISLTIDNSKIAVIE